MRRAWDPLIGLGRARSLRSDTGGEKFFGRKTMAFLPLRGLQRAHSRPLKPFELDTVRLDGGVPETALLVLLVVGEVAFEPLHVAVALERKDVGRHSIEEEAVMRDDDGAAGEV